MCQIVRKILVIAFIFVKINADSETVILGENQTQQIKSKAVYSILQSQKEKLINLYMTGEALLELRLFNQKENLILTKQITITNKFIYLVPIDVSKINDLIGGHIEIIVSNQLILSNGIFVNLTKDFFVSLFFNEINQIRIVSEFFNQLNIKWKIRTSLDENFKHLVYFNVKPSIMEFKEHQIVKFYLNQKRDLFPTVDDFEIEGEDGYGYSLQKSITDQEDYFCVDTNCHYYMLLEVDNFTLIDLVAQITTIIKEIDWKGEQFTVVDNINSQKNEISIQLPDFKEEGFVIEFENNLDLGIYVNFIERPQELSLYQFGLEKSQKFSLVHTNEEVKKFELSKQKVYIRFVVPSEITESNVIIRLQKIDSNYLMELPNQNSIQGNILNQEIINYYIYYPVSLDQQTYSFNLKLKSLKTNQDIYLKECLLQEKLSDCKVSIQDIQFSYLPQSQGIFMNRIFQSSKKIPTEQDNQDELNLSFNCIDIRSQNQTFNNNFAKSNSCIFAVAIYNPNKENETDNIYDLVRSNQEMSCQELNFQKDYLFQGLSGTDNYFNVKLTQQQIDSYKYFQISLVSMKGSGQLYISQDFEKPDEKNTNKIFQFDNQNKSIIKTKQYQFSEPLEDKKMIHFHLMYSSYSIVQIYIELYNEEDYQDVQRLEVNFNVENFITGKEQFTEKSLTKYYKKFYFEISDSIINSKQLYVAIDSIKTTLEICVQFVAVFDFKKTCDVYSNTELLSIDESNFDFESQKISLIVYQTENEESFLDSFPINFSIIIKDDFFQAVQMIPGKIYGDSIKQGDTQIKKISLLDMEKQGYILLTTSSQLVFGSLFAENIPDNQITVLSSNNFAVFISDATEFKSTYCNLKKCDFTLKISNTGTNQVTVYSAFVYDYIPLNYKESIVISIPNADLFHILIDAQNDRPLMLCFKSNFQKINIQSKIFDRDNLQAQFLILLENKNEYDYKLLDSNSGMITYKEEDMENYKPPSILFISQSNTPFQPSHSYTLLNSYYQIEIKIHSTFIQLEPFKIYLQNIQEGEFQYYQIIVDYAIDFTVMMAVQQGEADLYINKGKNNFPTLQNFWKKKDSYKGDEIFVEQDKKDHQQQIYTIGVYASVTSEISILYAPNFEEIISIEYQELMKINMTEKRSYLLDLDITQDNLILSAGSKGGIVKLTLIVFDENKGQNIIDLIYDENNFKQSFTLNPDNHMTVLNFKDKLSGHYILKVESVSQLSEFSIVVYDPQLPLKVFIDKEFTFSQEEKQQVIFMVDLKNYYEQVSVQTTQILGSAQIYAGETEDNQEMLYQINSQNPYEIKTIDHSTNDTIIAKRVLYLKIVSVEDCSYSILVKSNKEFQTLEPYKYNVINIEKNKSVYTSFRLSRIQLQQTSNLEFKIILPVILGYQPELYFFASEQVNLNEDTPFIPMPVVSYDQNQVLNINTIIFKTQILDGYYFIKFPETDQPIEALILININNNLFMLLNDFQFGFFRSSKMVLRTYVQSKGYLQIAYQTCQKIVNEQTYMDKNNSIQEQLNLTEQQISNQINVYDNTKSIQTKLQLSKQSQIYEIQTPGQITIENQLKQTNSNKIFQKLSNNFEIETFYRSSDKLYPYQYISMSNDVDFVVFEYETFIEIEYYLPKFISQFYQDFQNQNLKTWMEFYFVPYKQSQLTEFLNCGKSIINFETRVVQNFEYNLEDYQKGESNKKQSKIFEKNFINKNSSDQKVIIFAYFNYSILKDDSVLSLYTNSSIKQESLYFISIQPSYSQIAKKQSLFLYAAVVAVILFAFALIIYIYRRKQYQKSLILQMSMSSNQSFNNGISEQVKLERNSLDTTEQTINGQKN